jgi:putative Mn2+ efflux pump MntP
MLKQFLIGTWDALMPFSMLLYVGLSMLINKLEGAKRHDLW